MPSKCQTCGSTNVGGTVVCEYCEYVRRGGLKRVKCTRCENGTVAVVLGAKRAKPVCLRCRLKERVR